MAFLSCGSPLTWQGHGIQDTPKTNPIVVDLESYPKGETLRGSSSNFLKRFSCARRKSTSCYNLVYVCPFCPGQSYEIGAIGLIINYIYLFGTLRNIRIIVDENRYTCALDSFFQKCLPDLNHICLPSSGPTLRFWYWGSKIF